MQIVMHKLNIITVVHLYRYAVFKLIYNSLRGTVPIFLCAMIEKNRNERNSQNLRSFYHKKYLSEQGVKYSGPHIWNKLPLYQFLLFNSVPYMSCAIWCETSLIASGSILNIMYIANVYVPLVKVC